MTDCNFLINLFDLKNIRCCMSCHEDYFKYDMHIHEFYHPEYDNGYQALIVCCGLSEFCNNLTEEQWQKIILLKKWKKKLEKVLGPTQSIPKSISLTSKLLPKPIPDPMFERVEDQEIKKPKPKVKKSKIYFLKQFQDEFNSRKERMSIGCDVFEFGQDLSTGIGNILAAQDFWHQLFTYGGRWKLFTILILKKQKPLRWLEQELIKNFKGKDYIYVMKKSFLKRISNMFLRIFMKLYYEEIYIKYIKKVKIKKTLEVL